MCKVAGMNQEILRTRIAIDLVERRLERGPHVGIGRLVEADVAVADLNKAEVRLPRPMSQPVNRRVTSLAEDARYRNASRKAPHEPRPRPGHAFQKTAPVDTI
jgi:hypothetical protein